MNQNPSEWNGLDTTDFRPVHQQSGYGYGGPPPKQGVSPVLIVVLTVMAMLLLGVIGVGAFAIAPRLAGHEAASVTSTVSIPAPAQEAPAQPTVQPAQPAPVAPAASAPAGAYECVYSGGGSFSRAAVGSSVTSCEFAGSVRSKYLSSGGNGGSMVIAAYSPVTGRNYTMSCSGGSVVTCTGGNNAVVYIY
ncbi:MAG: serine/threonine protein kinase [Dietzia sp.]